jgi:predicted DNA-binding transcriptional regulator YafY
LTSRVVAPTSRLLELLELLQTKPLATGREIADQLGIDRRTVRRYIAALQALDIPIEGQRGVGGGYRIRPGYRLPPLMLTDDEAVVVALGLVAARHLGLDTEAQPVDGAATKIHRVLPEKLRRQVEALETTLGFTSPPTAGAPVAGGIVLLLADAVRRRRRVSAGYTSFEGVETVRELSPFGLVIHRGRWYLAAYDHVREDMRTFRIDRMRDAEVCEGLAAEPPDDFDVVAHISRSLARVPWRFEVEVLLELPFERAARSLPPTLAELTDQGERTLLRMRVSSLDWTARVLAGLDCGFSIRRPDELRTSMRELATRLGASVA